MEDKLKELQRIESARNDLIKKLEKIEEKKSTVSIEVYERVKKDYENKLKQIEKEISENRTLVEAGIAKLKEEDKTLEQDEKEFRLKIEEAELRYAIGEYDDATYQKLMEENKNNLAAITKKREEILNNLKWFEGLLGKTEVKEEKEEFKIDEHILEEKTPEAVEKIEELLVEEVKETSKPPDAEVKKEEKGIACPKCGFINTPDSWYCEKCGAEILSSLNL
uniref:RanBP2-type domain-containing protein n=1 Tax=candidate division WOR-3 bacterium TaxID=2052148 RepID=A0A7C4XA03_UNCW3